MSVSLLYTSYSMFRCLGLQCVSCRKTTKENIKEKKKVKEDKNGSKLQTVSKSWIATDYSWAGADTCVHTEEQKNEDSGKREGSKIFLMFPSAWGWMFTCKKVSTKITSRGFLNASYRSWRVCSCSKCLVFLHNSSKITSVCVTIMQFCITPWKYCQFCVQNIPIKFVRLPEDSVAENTQSQRLLWTLQKNKTNPLVLYVKVKPFSSYFFASIK